MNLLVECFTTKYADFSGRARRKEYWLFTLFPGTVAFLCGLLAATNQGFLTRNQGFAGIMVILLIGFVLAMIVPSLAVGIRRLHDTNRTGWWFLINFVPYLGGIVYLVFMLLPGTHGTNDYGEDPKAPPLREVRQASTPPRRQDIQQSDLAPAPPRKPIEVDYE